ncbi:MAG: hypothetical protein J2P28_25880 [Actinobacteria bacterium]|nr:hypothetical protein [Actinomycetota bacterium]
MTNNDRADLAEELVTSFANRQYADGIYGEQLETVLGDMLADMMHYARRAGIDWTGALAQAEGHHDWESSYGWDEETD